MRPVTVRTSRARAISATAVVALLSTALGASALTSATAEDDTDADRRVTRYENAKTSLVRVHAPTPKLRSQVAALPLDVTEHGTSKGVDVILHGERDAQVLRDAGFKWKVEIADLRANARKNARADARYARRVQESPLPSGRTSYRKLKDYNADLTMLHRRYPKLTKPITLRHTTVEDRRVRGIEITTNADRKSVV